MFKGSKEVVQRESKVEEVKMLREVGMGFIGLILIIGTPFGKPIAFFTAGEVLALLIGIALVVGGGWLFMEEKKKEGKKNGSSRDEDGKSQH